MLWLAVRGAYAAIHLVDARTEIDGVRAALLDGNAERAREGLAALRRETSAARRMTHDPLWWTAARVPVLGRSVRVVRGVAVAADELATGPVAELVEVGDAIAPSRLRVRGDTVAIEPLRRAAPRLESAHAGTVRVSKGLRDLPAGGVPGPLDEVRRSMLRSVDGLGGQTATAAAFARIAPGMLGGDGPRRYLLAVQNNAEARATGGLLGAYGIIEADRGRLRLTKLGTNSELHDTFPRPVVDLGADFTNRYRRFGADSVWLQANMSPHFPYASTIWAALYRKMTGVVLDGTIAIDPVGMAEILAVTGPARLPSGIEVNAGNVVDLTMRDAYARLRDTAVRDAFLQRVARVVYDRLVSGSGDPRALVSALARAAGGEHLQLAAARPDEAAVLAGLPIGGVLPDQPGPYVDVVTQNPSGNKLDFYLRRGVTYSIGPADAAGERRARLRVVLRNLAPPRGLPAYVVGRLDRPGGIPDIPGESRTYVSVYAGLGAGLSAARLDGRPVEVESELERGHPVFSLYVEIVPGGQAVLDFEIVETAQGPAQPVVGRQAQVTPDRVRVEVREDP